MAPGPRVLVVEDDDETRRALARELGSRGYAVDEAADGAAALAAQSYNVFRYIMACQSRGRVVPQAVQCHTLAFDPKALVLFHQRGQLRKAREIGRAS